MNIFTTSVYLIVSAKRSSFGRDPETGLYPIRSVRVVGLRQSRPKYLERDEVVVKIAVEIPGTIFNPFTPEATVVVTDDSQVARWTEVKVEGMDPKDTATIVAEIEEQLAGVAHVRLPAEEGADE